MANTVQLIVYAISLKPLLRQLRKGYLGSSKKISQAKSNIFHTCKTIVRVTRLRKLPTSGLSLIALLLMSFKKKKGRKKITWLYKEPDLKTLFKDIDGSAAILRAAADVRQNNPLIHASSKIIDTPTYKAELDKTVESLRILLDDEIANLPDSGDQNE